MEKVLTTSGIARAADVSEKTVRAYADAGLVDYERDSANRRVFPPTAVGQVRAAFRSRTRRIRRG